MDNRFCFQSWKGSVRGLGPIAFLLVAGLFMTSCQLPNIPGQSSYRPERPPDYNFPLAQFKEADFNVLASEFIDQYAGQYVKFDAIFLHSNEQPILRPIGSQRRALIMGLRGMTLMSQAGKNVQVIWAQDDRELGLPLVSLSMNAPVRIYAYVLPVGQSWRYKSRTDIYNKGLGEIVPILIKIEPR